MGMLLSCLACICTSFPVAYTDPGWVRLPLIGPHNVGEQGRQIYYLNNVQIGTPPASESLALDFQSTLLRVNSIDCVFCPGANLFDPSLSSTYKVNKPWNSNTTTTRGVVSQDTISFGGILTSQDRPFVLYQYVSGELGSRIPDGRFGLWVDLLNETTRQQHILSRLHATGDLMNPVVGFRMGRTPQTSSVTVGALDENDYDGTINWIETDDSDPTFSVLGAIKLDGFRGFNGSFLPWPSPLLASLDSSYRDILVPDAKTYWSEEGYRGPGDPFDSGRPIDSYSLPCNYTLYLSVQINGVNYEIESWGNIIREHDPEIGPECGVGFSDILPPAKNHALLGVPFLRSVYLAYRFPTAECPKAYYGFAFQEGANRTSSIIAQQPSSTPNSSAQCLSFTKPTATPSVSTPPPQISATKFVSKEKYGVWGNPDSAQVQLIGLEYLKAERAS